MGEAKGQLFGAEKGSQYVTCTTLTESPIQVIQILTRSLTKSLDWIEWSKVTTFCDPTEKFPFSFFSNSGSGNESSQWGHKHNT